MEHDGAIDDILSQILLLTMDNCELIGVNVTPADCYLEPAVESTYKVLKLFNKTDIPIGISDENGVNAFPNAWRARPEIINALPMLINIEYNIDPYSLINAQDLIIDKILSQDESVTILITGPCTNLVKAIKKEPRIKEKIEEIIWMGGAFRTQGNVQTYQHNGTAEWNVYWDPKSSKELFELQLPLVCIPLDVTNHVPVTKNFLSKLASQSDSPLSNLAGQLWAMTIDTIPSYHYVYFMWDTLATSYLFLQKYFTIEEVKADVSVRPPNEGQTTITPDGCKVKIAKDVDKEVFYAYLLKQLTTKIVYS